MVSNKGNSKRRKIKSLTCKIVTKDRKKRPTVSISCTQMVGSAFGVCCFWSHQFTKVINSGKCSEMLASALFQTQRLFNS